MKFRLGPTDNSEMDERDLPRPEGIEDVQLPGLDPVDLVRLARPARPAGQDSSTRWVALALVIALFAALLIMGTWLAAHVNSSGAASTSVGAARPAPQVSLSVPPPSERSSRR